MRALGAERATSFQDIVPEGDVIVFVKFKPSVEQLSQLKCRAKLVYCPFDMTRIYFATCISWRPPESVAARAIGEGDVGVGSAASPIRLFVEGVLSLTTGLRGILL